MNPNFFPKDLFPWADKLEKHTAIIRSELVAYLTYSQKNKWLESYSNYVHKFSAHGSWKVLTLRFFGINEREVQVHFPATMELLNSIDQFFTIQFSLMEPGTKILPHIGYSKTIARAHLPLIVPFPDQCGIRVGSEVRHWQEGNLIVFNDGIEHDAWNVSNSGRIILLLDTPNPEMKYSATDICAYKLQSPDEELLKIASAEKWSHWLEKGYFF